MTSQHFGAPSPVCASDDIAVACYLPTRLRRRFLAAIPSAMCVSCLTDRDFVTRNAIQLLVADPSLDTGTCADYLNTIRTRHPTLHIAVYTELSASVVGSIVQLATTGISTVLLFGHDDHPNRFVDLVCEVGAAEPINALLRALAPALETLPIRLNRAIMHVYRDPLRRWTMSSIATEACMTPRTTYRHFSSAGFGSPRRLVAAARLVRAFAMLRSTSRTISATAAYVGYRDADALTHQLRDLTGFTGRDIRSLSSSAFVSTLAKRLLDAGDSVRAPAPITQVRLRDSSRAPAVMYAP